MNRRLLNLLTTLSLLLLVAVGVMWFLVLSWATPTTSAVNRGGP